MQPFHTVSLDHIKPEGLPVFAYLLASRRHNLDIVYLGTLPKSVLLPNAESKNHAICVIEGRIAPAFCMSDDQSVSHS